MLRDLRHALRGLIRQPIVSLVVILTFALGIAAVTTVHSLVAPFLFRPLDYRDPGQLVHLFHVDPREGPTARFSAPQYDDWRAASEVYEDLAIYNYQPFNVGFDPAEPPEQVMTGRVSTHLFDLLGVMPQVGSGFQPEHQEPGIGSVVLLGHRLWQRRFDADPEAVGRELWIDGVAHRILGVMPEGFKFPFGEIQMWVPLPRAPLCGCENEPRAGTVFLMIGRLAAGYGLSAAIDEAGRLQQGLAQQYPDQDGYFKGARVVPLKEGLIFNYRLVRLLMSLMLGLVALVLLIVVANVANILLARAMGRAQEVAVRRAMGCSKARLIRLFLLESGLLALLGGAAGVYLASQAVGLLGAAIPEGLFRVGEYGLDAQVLGLALTISVLTAVFFGVAPALGTARISLADAVREGGAKTAGGVRGRRIRSLLASFQIFVAVVLILSAAFLLSSLRGMQTKTYGYDLDSVLTFNVSLPNDGYENRAQVMAYHEQAAERLKAIPWVEEVSAIYPLPLDHTYRTVDLRIDGWQPADPKERIFANHLVVAGDFFESAGIRVLSGRGILDSDTAEGERVVVINETFARRFFADSSPLQRQIHLLNRAGESTAVRVVGVVADIRHRVEWQEGDEIWPQLYQPFSQAPTRLADLVVRSERPEAVLSAVRQALSEIDPKVPVGPPRTLRQVAAASLEPIAMMSRTLNVFALVAMFLAAIGTYGVVAYTLMQRLREIGIRIALGAEPKTIRRWILEQSLRLVLYGILPGLALTLVGLRLLRGPLSGFGELGWGVIAGVAVAVPLLILLACLGLAKRAGELEPVRLLAQE